MHRLFILAGFCALLGSAVHAQQILLVSAQGDNGVVIVRAIQVNYIDVRALAQALGGTFVSLQPMQLGMPGNLGAQPAPLQPMGPGPVGFAAVPPGVPAAPAPAGGSLNRNAPLSMFVPSHITNIVGLLY